MKRTVLITIIVVLILSAGLISFVRINNLKKAEELNFEEALQGRFEIVVSGTGELMAERSMDIKGPNTVDRQWFRAAPLKITDIVPEGSIVKKGDYIATLDKSSFENTLKDELSKLNEVKSKYDMKLLDTAVVLNTLRDEIRNQEFVVQEAEIILAQSKYEPPATQRHAELDLDKARRMLEQVKNSYKLKRAQSSLEIRNIKTELRMQEDKVRNYQDILNSFIIKSPADGMITYVRDRAGVKIKTGSTIHPFNPIVATLPDLSSLKSKLYISEIDISKVKPGQLVEVEIDAFPEKSFTGKVASLANIGEVIPNADSKVFEVLVELDGSDPLLRPSMTTGNRIIINEFDNVVYIPLESVHAGQDSIPYVFTKNGTRQYVVLGKSNDKNIIVEEGIKDGTMVYMTTPEKYEKFNIAGSDLIPVIKARYRDRIAASDILESSINGEQSLQAGSAVKSTDQAAN